MWQSLISIDKHWDNSYKYILSRLNMEKALSYAIENTANRYLIHVASATNYKTVIDDIVAETLLMHFKYEFLSSRIRLNNNSVLNIALLSALIYSDKSHEKSVIMKILWKIQGYSIDALYDFRLGELKSNWQEVSDLVNSMLHANHSACDIYSLIEFILDMSEEDKPELEVYSNNGDITIRNLDNNCVIDIPYLSDKNPINIMTALFSANPSKIYLANSVLNNEMECILNNIIETAPINMKILEQ